MHEMKCPRCGGGIPIAEGTLLVRCPRCFAEYKVKRPTPMANAVSRFREHAGGQPTAGGPPPAGPIPLKPIASPAPVVQPVVVGPAPLHAGPGHRPRPANRTSVLGIVTIVLIPLIVLGTVMAIYLHRRGGLWRVQLESTDSLAPGSSRGWRSAEPEPSPQPRRPGPPAERTDRTPSTTSRPRPQSGEVEEPPTAPPAAPGPAKLNVFRDGDIHPNENEPTLGWLRVKVESEEERAISLARAVAHFFNAAGEAIWKEQFDVSTIPAGETVALSVEISGVQVSTVAADKTRFEVENVSWAAEDARPLQVAPGSVRIVKAENMLEDHKVVGRVLNPTTGWMYDVRVRVEVFDRAGRLLDAEDALVKSGATIPPNQGEDFSVDLSGDKVLDTERAETVVRAIGRYSANAMP